MKNSGFQNQKNRSRPSSSSAAAVAVVETNLQQQRIPRPPSSAAVVAMNLQKQKNRLPPSAAVVEANLQKQKNLYPSLSSAAVVEANLQKQKHWYPSPSSSAAVAVNEPNLQKQKNMYPWLSAAVAVNDPNLQKQKNLYPWSPAAMAVVEPNLQKQKNLYPWSAAPRAVVEPNMQNQKHWYPSPSAAAAVALNDPNLQKQKNWYPSSSAAAGVVMKEPNLQNQKSWYPSSSAAAVAVAETNLQKQKNWYPASSSSSSSSSAAAVEETNLQKLLRIITPKPISHSLSQKCKTDIAGSSRQHSKNVMECFKLGELWNCYEEWSAFGVGVPVRLLNDDSTTQYYVPYLSAIQIYTTKPIEVIARNLKEENEVAVSGSETWSDDSGSENVSRSLSHGSGKSSWDPSVEDSCSEPDKPDNTTCPFKERLGYLYLQFFETASPYFRVPLAGKLTELGRKYPGVLSLRSVDIAPASWMSVAWYPIYHIPSRKNEKDLSACFLSYHTLSSTFIDEIVEEEKNPKFPMRKTAEKRRIIPLPPFGLSTYKMQGNVWIESQLRDSKRLANLHNAANSWLKQVNCFHHDHNFFALNTHN